MSQKGKQDPDYEECPHRGMVRRTGLSEWTYGSRINGFVVACSRNGDCGGKCSDRFDREGNS